MNMKRILATMIAGLWLLGWNNRPMSATDTIVTGEQPQISTDNKGWIRMVFGRKDSIFCAGSIDQGVTFTKPLFVARVPEMHLGMSRGPQIACSANYAVITAMDKSGNIYWFRYSYSSPEWKEMGFINDEKGSSPEGLMSIAADRADHFYAVWLDIRTGKHNQVYFSSLAGNATDWSKNEMVYQSPDGHVCECCKPNISAEGSVVAIMFRNWLNGSRDLYLLQSSNKGKSFRPAQKLGTGTWKLNGCPMDGGGMAIDPSGVIQTVWQRQGQVYYCKPGETEVKVGNGRTCNISGTAGNTVICMQHSDTVKVVKLYSEKEIIVGTGGFLNCTVLPDNKILCIWEKENKIKFKRI
jgi:hypothetical protein